MSVRYIGSKTRVAKAILEHIGEPDGGTFHDAFSGTGAVAQAASEAGWKVHVNDHLISAAMMSFARVTSSAQTGLAGIGDYSRAIADLNAAKPVGGSIWREYSPASASHCDVARMYFTEDNAKKIDGMRTQIERWRENGRIDDAETCVLVADLLGAANRVANTAGTYGCFLSRWQRQSLTHIEVVARDMPRTAPMATMTSKDVVDIDCEPRDTIYFDPPYTKRQYAAYYHILETIALGDRPTVEGVGGIRPWKDKASVYCYKVRAAEALESLVDSCRARRVFLWELYPIVTNMLTSRHTTSIFSLRNPSVEFHHAKANTAKPCEDIRSNQPEESEAEMRRVGLREACGRTCCRRA